MGGTFGLDGAHVGGPRRGGERRDVVDNIRAKTGRSNGKSLPCIIAEVNRTLRGWFEYFKHSTSERFPALINGFAEG